MAPPLEDRRRRYADLAALVLERPPRLGPVRLVAIDGPAGSGKTTFARRLATALRAAGAEAGAEAGVGAEAGASVGVGAEAAVAEIHTDDLLAGWTDIVSFWSRLERWVLDPLRRGVDGAYRTYDWHAADWGREWTALPVPEILVLEGVTTARAAVRAELSLAVFVVADRDLRLARGLARDGDALRPQWLRWMSDEDAHFARDRTADQVDMLVDGAPDVVHEAEGEFVSARPWVDARGWLGDDPGEHQTGRRQ